jgi:mRNA-degrading endonuclease RelE of RelBE toxin-antitoxin system
MKKTFVETAEFSEWVRSYLSDEALSELQKDLLENPEVGAVMPGCGGLRKIRAPDAKRGKGKRGGVRVIYLDLVDVYQIHLITIYGKDQKDDLSAADKKLYSRFVEMLKAETRRAKKVWKK